MASKKRASIAHILLTCLFALACCRTLQARSSANSCIFQRQPGAGEKNKSRASITELHPDRWKEKKERARESEVHSWRSQLIAQTCLQERLARHKVERTRQQWPCEIIGKDRRAPNNGWLKWRIIEKQNGRMKQNCWNTDELTADNPSEWFWPICWTAWCYRTNNSSLSTRFNHFKWHPLQLTNDELLALTLSNWHKSLQT